MRCEQPGPFEGVKCWKEAGHDGDHADAGFGYHLAFDGRFGKGEVPK